VEEASEVSAAPSGGWGELSVDRDSGTFPMAAPLPPGFGPAEAPARPDTDGASLLDGDQDGEGEGGEEDWDLGDAPLPPGFERS
jgi:hypothetical protein